MSKLKQILVYAWQLPQNLLGLLLVWIYKAEYLKSIDTTNLYVGDKMRGAISLGKYVILSSYSATDKLTHYHEFGHSRDSKNWGWFYLLVIGIPSILNAAFGISEYYYDFWTERRADRLGGIVRDDNNNRVKY